MKISVIIPTYKPKDYLWKCLDSLKEQIFLIEDFEIIIILNGCREPYYSEIKDYISSKLVGYNVNFIQTDIAGVSNARNIGLDCARGKFVSFIDDDDYVSRNYLSGLYKLASDSTIPVCYPFFFNDGKENLQIPNRITAQYDEISCKGILPFIKARKFFAGPWMKLIPMDSIQNRKFDVRFKNGEDSLFMFLISDHFKNVAFTDKDVCYYRRYRSGSAVTVKQSLRYRLSNNLKLFKAYCNIYFSSVQTYNFSFFITRILGTIKKLFI